MRQFRAGLVEETVFDEQRQAALGQVLWHALGGGYPGRNALVPEKARARVFERTGERCEACGAPATTFDHIGSACNRPINLRPMCEDCAETKPFGDPTFLAQPEVVEKLRRIAARIGSPAPLRCCDNAESWDWRAYLSQRNGRATSL